MTPRITLIKNYRHRETLRLMAQQEVADMISSGEYEQAVLYFRRYYPTMAYATVGNFSLDPVNDEVDEGRYWTEEEIAAAIGKGILTPNFENEYQRIGPALRALL